MLIFEIKYGKSRFPCTQVLSHTVLLTCLSNWRQWKHAGIFPSAANFENNCFLTIQKISPKICTFLYTLILILHKPYFWINQFWIQMFCETFEKLNLIEYTHKYMMYSILFYWWLSLNKNLNISLPGMTSSLSLTFFMENQVKVSF